MTVWTEMAAEIKKILDGAGFTAMGEYTSADSLLHSGEAIGFYGLKGYDVVDEVIGQGGKNLYTEYICHIDLRLMGKAGKYDDMEELQEKCESVMAELAKSDVLNVKSAKLGSAVQTLPLHRLERQAELSIGICSEEDISE
ncbi:hypothetical protein [Ruminococcus sp.]|uniref:hypothetical protein n=1 Tax=Ruminococcus sp. TaxID=41978 RepID=UPI003966B232